MHPVQFKLLGTIRMLVDGQGKFDKLDAGWEDAMIVSGCVGLFAGLL